MTTLLAALLLLLAPGETYRVTGYLTYGDCGSWCDGRTASMTRATVGRTAACPPDLPFGTRIYVEGVGERVCEDRGSAIRGKRIDVLVSTKAEAYALTGERRVWVKP